MGILLPNNLQHSVTSWVTLGVKQALIKELINQQAMTYSIGVVFVKLLYFKQQADSINRPTLDDLVKVKHQFASIIQQK